MILFIIKNKYTGLAIDLSNKNSPNGLKWSISNCKAYVSSNIYKASSSSLNVLILSTAYNLTASSAKRF